MLGVVDIVSWIMRSFRRQKPAPTDTVNPNEWVDLDLSIEDVVRNDGVLAAITAKGQIDGQRIGFAFDVFPEWKAQKTDEGATFYWGRARYRSIGTESDQFLQTVSRLYIVGGENSRMSQATDVVAVGLADDPRRLFESPIRLKCFFESESDDATAYAEVYTNIDLAGRVLQFHEKDQEYRAALVRALRDDA
jgi:hypothetical protein